MADLSYITIDRAPNKTTYRTGDRFERYGMAVKAHYSDGTSSAVDFYSYSPSGALSTSNTQITVEFSGKTATQSITVLPVPQDGYFGTRYLGGAEYGGNPCVNACDLSVRFRNDPIALGSDPYRIALALSYCSGMPDRESDLIKGLPKGWRTDWHRFLVQDGTDQSNHHLYKYIDGDGYVHCFKYNVSTGSYRDIHGQGLTLDPTARTITDLQGNVLSFDSSGRLISMTSGIDPDCEKVVEYNSDGIRKIYDSRDPGTYIMFSYQNSYIKYIRLYKGGDDPIKTYTLGGFPGQITSLDETVGNSTRTLCQYAVNDRDLLRRAVDCMTKDAWRITYEFDQGLNSYRMDSIRKGYLDGDSFVQHEGMHFASRDQDASFGGPCVRELTVSDGDGIDMSVMTDSEGALVSILERGHGHPDDYYPLVRDEGIWLGNEGPGPEAVSASSAKWFSGDLPVSGIHVSLADLNDAFDLRLIGWIKVDGRPNRARLYASCDDFSCEPIDLNPRAYRVWQYFELPIKRTFHGSSVRPIESFTLSLRDADGCLFSATVANLQMAERKEKESALVFLNGPDDGAASFDEIAAIRLYADPLSFTATVSMASPVYMTRGDLLMTMMRCHGQTGPGIVYFNGGREAMRYGYSFVGVTASGTEVPFLERSHLDNSQIGTSTNWFFAEHADAPQRACYRFEGAYWESVSATKIGSFPSPYYECQASRYDYHGRLILRTGKDGSRTKYEYFQDGRLKKAGVLTQDGEAYASVLYEASLDQNDRNMARLTQRGMSRDFQYHSDGLLWKTAVNSVQNGQISNTAFCRELSYDAFRDDVACAMFKDGETIREEHSYSRPSQSYKTNHFGDIAGRMRVGYEISTKTAVLGIHDGNDYSDVLTTQESSHATTRTYDNVQTHGGGYQEVAEEFDEYGFPASVSCGGVPMATFAYEENFASRYCSLLESVTDLFSGRSVSIDYDKCNELVFAQIGAFSVSCYKDDDGWQCAEYAFGAGESYVCKSGASSSFAIEDSLTVGPTLWSYSHDGLGRVTSKYNGYYASGLNQTYLYSSELPSRVASYSFGNSYSESYSYGDGFGNITGVGVSSSLFPYASSYQFDGLGRIVSETNTKLGISRSYQYESFGDHASGPVGRMISFGNASMEYDEKGRLVQFGSIIYSYDHYGNRVSRNQISYQWERGTLLSYCGFSRFEYDYRGLRSLKVDASGLTHEYFYDGERLVGEDIRDGSSTVRKLRYFYDLDGLCALRVIEGDDTSDYVYIRNPLGDIVGLSEGSAIKALYVYDAWGNHKVYDQYGAESTNPSFIGNVNPFRYRGYYFDSDTGLYYLRSRYYDPEIGQFISPDDVGYMDFETIGGLNLYAYCNYNPVMYSDPSGRSVLFFAVLGLCALLGVGAGLTIGGRLSGNETLTNIGDSIISSVEIIGGVALIATGIGGPLGMALLGTGVGSIANGLIGTSKGGKFHAGWAGGQLSGSLSLIPYFGIPIGTFFGSVLTDLINSKYVFANVDLEKAGWSAVVAFGLSWFGNVVDYGVGKGLFESTTLLKFILSYEYALLGVANSIVNVWWPERRKIV